MTASRRKPPSRLFLALSILGVLLTPAAGSVSAANATVTVDYGTVVRTLATEFHGVNYVAFWDDAQGNYGSREALRRSGIKLIRFPGGEPGNWYDWNKATTWTTTDTLDMKAYAAGIGARLMFQTNPTTNTVNDNGDRNDPSGTHAADWVTYCQNNGVDAPFWEVGNEPDIHLTSDYDWVGLQWYFDRFNEQAPAMRARNPAIKVMGPAGTNAWYWWGLHTLDMFIQRCGGNADAVSLHWYTQDTDWNGYQDAAQSWQSNMDHIRSVTSKPLYITEWNAGGGANDTSKTAGLALANADIIGAFAKSGVAGHCFFGCIHNVNQNWGILCGNGDYRPLDSAAPSYFILPLWTKMGDRVLNVANTADAATVLSAWAHKKSDGSVQVMLINKGGSFNVDVKFTGFDPTDRTVRIYELKARNGSPADWDVFYNGALNPNPAASDLPGPSTTTCAGATFNRTLPAYSVTLLDFAGGGGGDTQAPTVPTGLTATAISSSRIDLSWNPSTDNVGVTGYKVYRGGDQIGTSSTTSYSDTGLSPGTTYSYTVASYDAAGNTSAQSSPASATTPPSGGAGTGLKGEYYDNKDLTNLKLARTDATVNFDWGSGSPDSSIAADTFSARWTGRVQPLYSQTYTFYTYTDDGVRLWVNNQLIIDKWVDQAPREWSGTIDLTAGQKYDIMMEYYENGGGAVARLSWSSASQAKQIIPQSQLYPPSSTPYVTRDVPCKVEAEDFDNGGEGVAYHDADSYNNGGAYRTGEGVDLESCSGGGYNVGWTAAGEWINYTVNVPAAGTYDVTFRVASPNSGKSFKLRDNGSDKCTVNVPNTGGWQTWTNVTQSIALSAGTRVLTVYCETDGLNLDYLNIAPHSAPVDIKTECESGTRTNWTVVSQTGASGGQGARCTATGNALSFSISIPSSGTYRLYICNSHGAGGWPRTTHMDVDSTNDVWQGTLPAANDGESWDVFRLTDLGTATLTAGTHTFRIRHDYYDGYEHLYDYFRLVKQ